MFSLFPWQISWKYIPLAGPNTVTIAPEWYVWGNARVRQGSLETSPRFIIREASLFDLNQIKAQEGSIGWQAQIFCVIDPHSSQRAKVEKV